jgi:hypothetical protein
MNSFDAALDALREILAARTSGPAVLTFNAGGAQLIFSHLPSATYPRPLHVTLRRARCSAARLKHLAYLRLEPNFSCFGNHPILNHDSPMKKSGY